jgi:hypothetical protein
MPTAEEEVQAYVPVCTRVSPAERDQLKALAVASDRTVSREIYRAVRMYLEHELRSGKETAR